jgi:4-hydroxy 2-oxovalerate aldolase
VVDNTTRDGGLMNNYQFSGEVVKDIYNTCVEFGIDHIEIGYKGDKKQFSQEEFASWKFCPEEAIRNMVGERMGQHTKFYGVTCPSQLRTS